MLRNKVVFTSLLFISVDFVLPNKGESILDAYHKWRTRATNKVCCDYSLHVGLVSWSDQVNLKILILFKNFNWKTTKLMPKI